MYDPVIGRFTGVDPLADIYSQYSPYGYVVNRPLNAVDKDGRLVIFINGLGSKGEKYWMHQKRKLIANGGKNLPLIYSDRITAYNFAQRVKKHLGDQKSLFYDGSPYSLVYNIFPQNRYNSGYGKGLREAAKIIAKLDKDTNGNITESIKIITHSMGAVYGKGFVDALLNYIQTNKDEKIRRVKITLIADFDGFQNGSKYGTNNTGIKNQQFINKGFAITGLLANQSSDNAEKSGEADAKRAHGLAQFLRQIDNLEEGKYVWNEQQQRYTCTNCKN